jgi:hypothetical protein
LALVQYNECENHLNDSMFSVYLSIFLYKEIGKHLHISFDDFINRPKYEIELIIKTMNEYMEKKNKDTKNILDSIKQEIPKKE